MANILSFLFPKPLRYYRCILGTHETTWIEIIKATSPKQAKELALGTQKVHYCSDPKILDSELIASLVYTELINNPVLSTGLVQSHAADPIFRGGTTIKLTGLTQDMFVTVSSTRNKTLIQVDDEDRTRSAVWVPNHALGVIDDVVEKYVIRYLDFD